MPYSELIKSFQRVRDYMRQFYVYGFKSRTEYDAKSARSYDNERRRIESWLGDYMFFRQDAGGKNVFLSVDSRTLDANPLYSAFKAKSFTAGDITFHFYILDLLAAGGEYTVKEILETVTDKYLSQFPEAQALDESTLRKKLKEYEELGILKCEKQGRELKYSRAEDGVNMESWREAVEFFSEENPLGVIGSFMLDKYPKIERVFGFKHHYILHALDSEVLLSLLTAMNEKRAVELMIHRPRTKNDDKKHVVFPVKILISSQSGRQYLLGYHYKLRRPMFFRLDSVSDVKPGAVEKQPERCGGWYDKFAENLWGTSAGAGYSIDHLEMTVHIGEGEEYILDRLEREKRCGRLEMQDSHTCRFVADVYDATEMLPWVRTFIGRIEKLECSNEYVTDTFNADLDAVTALYGGETNAV